MGLLDQLKGALGSSGGSSAVLGSLAGMLASGQGGGLQGLIKTLNDQGLGNVVSSWVGTGANLPITAQQIEQVLGNAQLQQIAAQHGLDVKTVAAQISQHLPALVDGLTPNGKVPDAASLEGMLKGFLR